MSYSIGICRGLGYNIISERLLEKENHHVGY